MTNAIHRKLSQVSFSTILAVIESRDLISVSRRVPRPIFWNLGLGLGLEGLRSRLGLGLEGFRSRSRALRLETLQRLFFMKFCKKEFPQKMVLNMIVQNLAVQRGQWLSFLCCYVVCKMEKTICPLPRLKFILNSIKKCACTNETAARRLISATRGWEYFANDYL